MSDQFYPEYDDPYETRSASDPSTLLAKRVVGLEQLLKNKENELENMYAEIGNLQNKLAAEKRAASFEKKEMAVIALSMIKRAVQESPLMDGMEFERLMEVVMEGAKSE